MTPTMTTTTSNENDCHDEKQNGKQVTPPKGSRTTTTSGSPRKTNNRVLGVFSSLLRRLLLDLPVLLVFGLYVATHVWTRFATDYLLPQMDLMKWTPERSYQELTYYHRVCDVPDQSTREAADLLVDTETLSSGDVTQLMLEHGAAVFPNVLSPGTAHELREFILKQNAKNQDMIYVIANENRWSFFLRVDQDPSVATVLEEMLNQNPLLVASLDRIAGRNPAVIEFTTITSAFGAQAQHWHQDVVPESNGAKYSRNFVPSYSLFIPLQDTTAGMGATGICPGTHMCAGGCGEFCQQTGFQMSKAFRNETDEYWPVGWGALVNQQTTHIGMPHTDPNAPHRVVLVITFAPRPRFGDKEMETRLIGLGGSYSLHWSQWGHTLREFANPTQLMGQPWRSIRSLGLYKPQTADWGWDYMTQAAGRISNAEVGFFRDEFDTFFNTGGFFFLPRSWQGDAPSEEVDDTQTWIQFLTDTTRLCQSKLRQAYFGILLVSLVLGALVQLAGGKGLGSAVKSSIVRLGFVQAIIVLAAWWLYGEMESTSWALNIRRSASYRIPRGPHAALPDLPASLPMERDILILNEMQSDYMSSFSQVLEVVHPGNKAWHELVKANSPGYSDLSSQLQATLRSSMLQSLLEDQRRIMTKTQNRNWATVDTTTADWFCHKELSTESNRYIKKAIQLLDYMLAETRFGFWRDTVLHREHIPGLLMNLEHAILHSPESRKSPVMKHGAPRKVLRFRSFPFLPPTTSRFQDRPRPLPQRSGPPQRLSPKEPYPGAWFREGDTVEATFDGRFEEWYRGFIQFADSDQNSWDVEYEDGDQNLNLCRRCVRPFEPYRINESVEVRISEGSFAPAKVVARSDDMESFQVQLNSSGDTIKNVSVVNIRRVTARKQRTVTRKFSQGDVVLARFPGEPAEEWFPGVVAKVNNDDGTYAIQYDDGDFASRVRGSDITLSYSVGVNE